MSITQETRREAYHDVLPKIPPMAFKVLTAVNKLGEAIAEEVMAVIGTHNPNNVAPRLTGLRDDGYIEAIDRRPNCGGHNMTVWRLTDKGKAALRTANTESGMQNNSTDKIAQDAGGCQDGS